MNKHLFLLAFCTALGAVSAQAADTGFYVGASGGQAELNDFKASDIDAELFTRYGLTSHTRTDDTDSGWKVFAGYRLMKFLAVEGAYTDLGDATARTIITAPLSGVVNTSMESDAWTISALGILPLGDRFSLFGRVGVNFWNADISATGSPNVATVSGSDDGTDMVYGVGLAYNFSNNLGVRTEWERYELDDGDIDFLSAGVSWNF